MQTHSPSRTLVSRRRALGLLSLSGAALAAGGVAAPLHADELALPRIDTPADALAELMGGNRRFVEGRPVGPHRSLDRVRDLREDQKPFAAVLSCADSRVPVEIVFDQGFGDLFVCRAAGNIATPELTGSLEFGTRVLGAQALVVLGHTRCGAVRAAIANQDVPGQISTLYAHIRPAVDRSASRELDDVVRENVRVQVNLLRTASTVIPALVDAGRLAVVGAMYDLQTGRVTLLND